MQSAISSVGYSTVGKKSVNAFFLNDLGFLYSYVRNFELCGPNYSLTAMSLSLSFSIVQLPHFNYKFNDL